MKNLTVAITLGILLLSSALLVFIPNNIVAQEEETDEDYTMTRDKDKSNRIQDKTSQVRCHS